MAVVPPWLGGVSREALRSDVLAGLTGATIVLPQAVAFAAIAGLPPEYGFFTAMVMPVVAAFAGSSWHAVSGPTTAISALVFGALAGSLEPFSAEFIQVAIALSLMVGIIQLLLGFAKLGALVDFVSHSVMTGFVAGAAILIALSQLQYILAIDLPRPSHLPLFLEMLLERASGVSWPAVVVSIVTLAAGIGVKRWRPGLPNYLLALAAGSVVGWVFSRSGAEIASIGVINAAAPRPMLPPAGADLLRTYGSAAFAIALVGLLEALAVSRAIATRSGQPIDGNREIVGQGASNFIGSFFQCYPGSASFTRSGVNYEAGARTPLSAIFAAGFLFLILQFVAPWSVYVPVSAMAGVILLVAWRLIDFKEIRHIATTSASESAIALSTFLATLFIDLEFSVYVGVFLSFLFFVRSSSRPTFGIGAPDPNTATRMFRNAEENGLKECPQLVVMRLDGPLFFGSVEFVRRKFRSVERERPDQKHMLFAMKGVGEVDMPGSDLLIEEAGRRHRRGGSFHIMTRTPKTITKLARFKVMRALTKKHIHLSKGDAVSEIVPLLDPDICRTCTARIFRECSAQPGHSGANGSPHQTAGENT
ncbi:SulP family inorganic anion transporter [Leisingera thetidis]|uniref:SulP family inorganic anion transporter n=1 Tax=Leisingera thetidis TaxID=2930199 RepID=UPI0021F6CC9C|nr:SulP family inorganic anion transporter [Leisingera thetidis]